MVDNITDRELITVTIDRYTDLQRIRKSDNPEKEVEYQLRVAKAKLESFGIITSDLEID